MENNQTIAEIVERSLEVALREVKERIIKKYEVKMMDDFREEMAKIVLRTEQFYSVQRQGMDLVITLKNRITND